MAAAAQTFKEPIVHSQGLVVDVVARIVKLDLKRLVDPATHFVDAYPPGSALEPTVAPIIEGISEP